METIPINKYKLGANNITKTYEGGTKINKMYVGSNLVYRALPTTTPQFTIPLDEVWYKSSTNANWPSVSGARFIDANGNQLTYTTILDTDTGLMKMKFNGNVGGYSGEGASFNLIELYLPQGFVYMNDSILYHNTGFQKFYGDSPSIKDGGNIFVNLKQGDTNYNTLIETAKDINGSITVPEGVTNLGAFSFKSTIATSITLPSTLTYIGRFCFQTITATDMYCYATTPPSVHNNGIWLLDDYTATFHYPDGSDYSSFRVPTGWTKVGDL